MITVNQDTVNAVLDTPIIRTILALPYSVLVETDEDGTMCAEVLELRGCITEVDDENKLDEMVQDAIVTWVVDALLDGETIPLPRYDM